MTLFEFVTNKTGESYCRAYVWAATEFDAVELYAEKNNEPFKEVNILFDEDYEPFSTTVSDSGWE